MKITAVQSKPQFEPITLTIEIADETTLRTLQSISAFDQTIPSLLVRNDFILPIQVNSLSELLEGMSIALNNY